MNIVYMGTPDIAKTVLERVIELSKEEPAIHLSAVFTQPDKPVGRRQVLTPPPVKVLAQENGIPVYQPKRIKRDRWVQLLKELQPDLILVTAFGQILSQEILDIPGLGCINLHTSLLPHLRGAAPIQWAIVSGETVTGVTAMQMDAGMDTGDILHKREVPVASQETADTLYEKLSRTAGDMAVEILLALLQGDTLPRQKQEEADATYAPIIRKEDGIIAWEESALSIDRKVRGFIGWPGAYGWIQGRKVTILSSHVLTEETIEAAEEAVPGQILPAYAFGDKKGKHPRLLVQSGEGMLEILRLQVEGKKPMAAEDYLRGLRELVWGFDLPKEQESH